MKLHPEFISSLQGFLGKEKDDLLEALTSAPPVSIRYNPAKVAKDNSKEQIPWSSQGVYLSERPAFTLNPLLHAGAFYVQEASSMFLEQAVKQHLQEDIPITALDLCAAPGGKSTLLSSILKSADILVCNEVIRPRADILQENMQKWGNGNIIITRNDPASFSKLQGCYDLIVVDAPCSGEGMFRKDPRAVLEWSPANVLQCAARQKKILTDVWSSLKPGGILIYSTCTFNREENESNVQWAVDQLDAENPELSYEEEWGIAPSVVPGINAVRFHPHKTRGEGLFMAVLKKKEEAGSRKQKTAPVILPADKKTQQLLQGYTTIPNPVISVCNDVCYALPQDQFTKIQEITAFLYPIQPGTALGTIKGNDLIPHPALALSQCLNREKFPEYEADHHTALSILSRETPFLQTAEEGWNLVTHQGLGIGWIKKMQNRVNNYYPKEWRIRMEFKG